MRIATWNINGMRARLAFVQHWLAAREPDVVGLQELKMADDKFPHDALAECGYVALTHGQKSWNGVAVLVRRELDPEPELLQPGLPGQEGLGARLITARVAGLRFTTVYCPNGKSLDHEDFPRKLTWFDALIAHAAPGDEPAVLCGDFNICPAAIDSWNEPGFAGRIFHTEEERSRFRRLAELGWRDLFREKHPRSQAYSWWDYRGGAFHKKQGLRIDFLLASQSVLERTTAVSIDRDYRKKKDGMTASDHAPVIAELA